MTVPASPTQKAGFLPAFQKKIILQLLKDSFRGQDRLSVGHALARRKKPYNSHLSCIVLERIKARGRVERILMGAPPISALFF